MSCCNIEKNYSPAVSQQQISSSTTWKAKFAFLLTSWTYAPANWKLTCWSRTESFMWNSESLGMKGYFWYTVSKYTPTTQRRTQAGMCMHVFVIIYASLYLQVCVPCKCKGGLDFTGQEPSLFLCACTRTDVYIRSCGHKRISQNLWELSAMPTFCQLSSQIFPSGRGTEGFSVCLCVCVCLCTWQMILDPVILLMHSSQGPPLGCN